jgi:glycosyltransferase involved in cell wall biosynthesis
MTFHVSVIATVKNEAQAVHKLLDSLAAQTHPPDEVIIVDGGSTDGTLEVLEEYAAVGTLPLKVLVRPGTNISQGRNAAIAVTSGEIIASTDAGVRLSPNWLEELVKPFEGPNPPDVVGGFFVPDPQTVFETAMGATVLPALEEIDLHRRFRKFFPSSRSIAFRNKAWEQVGGYPEWLDYSEDLMFDKKLQDEGFRFAFAPTAIAYFRPRSSLKSFWIQYYQYARGAGKADVFRFRHFSRYATYLFTCVVVALLFWFGFWQSPLWWSLLFLGAAVVLWTPYKRLRRMIEGFILRDKLKAIALVPIIRVTGDIAKMTGYPVGRLWRLTHHSDFKSKGDSSFNSIE